MTVSLPCFFRQGIFSSLLLHTKKASLPHVLSQGYLLFLASSRKEASLTHFLRFEKLFFVASSGKETFSSRLLHERSFSSVLPQESLSSLFPFFLVIY
jgi:hypothetical protein